MNFNFFYDPKSSTKIWNQNKTDSDESRHAGLENAWIPYFPNKFLRHMRLDPVQLFGGKLLHCLHLDYFTPTCTYNNQ